MASPLEFAGAAFFLMAVLHTLCVQRFVQWSRRFKPGSPRERSLHILGEVEAVFAIWAGIYLVAVAAFESPVRALETIEESHFTEPAFVFVILALCSTRPILQMAESLIGGVAGLLPLKRPLAFYVTALTVGPLLGSFITEPAAMTVVALLLLDRFYQKEISERLKYATLGLLFVNISVGGVLTPFAAPPVLMVAEKWDWDLTHMLGHFGWRGALTCVIATALVVGMFAKEIRKVPWPAKKSAAPPIPLWVKLAHLLVLGAVVALVHHPLAFIGVFVVYLALYQVTGQYQDPLRLKAGLLVGVFLAGLVILGAPQRWWLQPLLQSLSAGSLFAGATALTAVTDNAALTYLGTLVADLPDASRYALVAGAVTGGGLTVIANAPNPAGFGILSSAFEGGISPFKLFLGALGPTLVGGAVFWVLG